MYTDEAITNGKKEYHEYSNKPKNNNTVFLIIGTIITIIIVYFIFTNKSESHNDSFTLTGSDVTIMYKEEYIEPGYKYIDKDGTDLTSNVQVVNNINNKVPGIYKVIYKYNNQILTRKVTVMEPNSYDIVINYQISNTELTNQNIIINYEVIGETFYKVELPNGNISNDTNGSFTVENNGTYVIKAYNEMMDKFQKEIVISNILRDKPTGTCTLSLLNKGGKITVTADKQDIIKGYQYIYGNNKSNILPSNEFGFDTLDEKSSVILYDKAGNDNTITCNNVDKSDKQTSSYTKETVNNKKYMLYVPSVSLREKIPLVIYFHGSGGLKYALPKNITDGKTFPYYIVNPIEFTQNSGPNVMEIIATLTSKYNIDTDRIVISGGSAGSPTALQIASLYPNIFSGIVIIAGYSGTVNINPSNITHIPIWIFQGTNDNNKIITDYANKINNMGGNATITWYPGYHEAPNDAFLREDLTKWILTNKKK